MDDDVKARFEALDKEIENAKVTSDAMAQELETHTSRFDALDSHATTTAARLDAVEGKADATEAKLKQPAMDATLSVEDRATLDAARAIFAKYYHNDVLAGGDGNSLG